MASAGAHTDERCRQPAFLPGPPPPEVESSSGSAKVSAAPSRSEPRRAAPSRATPRPAVPRRAMLVPRDACAVPRRAEPSRAVPAPLPALPTRVTRGTPRAGPARAARGQLAGCARRGVRCGAGTPRAPPGYPRAFWRWAFFRLFFFNNYLFFICLKKIIIIIIFAWVGGAQRCPHPPARLLRAPCAGRARRGCGEGGGGGSGVEGAWGSPGWAEGAGGSTARVRAAAIVRGPGWPRRRGRGYARSRRPLAARRAALRARALGAGTRRGAARSCWALIRKNTAACWVPEG